MKHLHLGYAGALFAAATDATGTGKGQRGRGGRNAPPPMSAPVLPVVAKIQEQFPNLKGFADEKQADMGLLDVIKLSESVKNKWQEFARRLVIWSPTMAQIEAYVAREETSKVIGRGLAAELHSALLIPSDAVPEEKKELRRTAQAVVATYKARVLQYAREIIEGKKEGEEREALTLSDIGEGIQKLADKHGKIEGADPMTTLALGEIATNLIKGGSLLARLENVVAMIRAVKTPQPQ